MTKTIKENLSDERKELQKQGLLPEWFTTQGWQMFKSKYLYDCSSYKEQLQRIARVLSKHTQQPNEYEKIFFDLMWKGWLAPSTPVLSNTGTDKGCPVSCSGGYVEDTVYSFYENALENAVLSKNSFGTSSYLSNIRPRGSKTKGNGTASGVVPVIKTLVNVIKDISQGSRRGAWAGYLDIDHDDFWEVCEHIKNNPDDCNIGWNVSNAFIKRLEEGDTDALKRFQRALKVKATIGKGYFYFVDKVAEQQPQMYKDKGLRSKASNLCTEITLHSDEKETFSCVLSSMNLRFYDDWKDTDAVFNATIFLDCVAQEFIEIGKKIKGLEKVVRFTERHRALGLGALGFHTYLQDHNIPFESYEAHALNHEIFSLIQRESLKASKHLYEIKVAPEVCRWYGVGNTHRTAIAPNLSSSILAGGVSQGIEPFYSNVFEQGTAAGTMDRINPSLIVVMKQKGVYNQETIENIIDNKGSVQHVDWLNEHEKMVFKTAFEIDQRAILRLASERQRYICQAQSINLFFDADEKEEYISEIHKIAFLDKRIKSLYYLRTKKGTQTTKNACLACEG